MERGRTVRITDWIHPSLNDWTRMHWSMKHRQRLVWAARISSLVYQQGGGRFVGPVRVTVTSFLRHKRRRDADNLVPKFILDALVDAKVIQDDSTEYVASIVTEISFDPKNPRTEIRIEPYEAISASSAAAIASASASPRAH